MIHTSRDRVASIVLMAFGVLWLTTWIAGLIVTVISLKTGGG
jgi:hypothetical protein